MKRTRDEAVVALAQEVMGWHLDNHDWLAADGLIMALSDRQAGSLNWNPWSHAEDALQLAEAMHVRLLSEPIDGANYLTLVCTGVTTGWVASFDANIEVSEWYEDYVGLPYKAKGTTPSEAITLAVCAALGWEVE